MALTGAIRAILLDLVAEGRTRGIVVRDLVTGSVSASPGDAVVLATGGYGNAYCFSTNAKGCNAAAIWRAHKRGAAFVNPCFTQTHPTCIPVSGEHQSKLTLMSESLRNDGRVWVPKGKGDARRPDEIPEAERDDHLERKYPSLGNLAARDVTSRAAKEVCNEGRGVGPGGRGVYLDFADALRRLGAAIIRERYASLFEMYQHDGRHHRADRRRTRRQCHPAATGWLPRLHRRRSSRPPDETGHALGSGRSSSQAHKTTRVVSAILLLFRVQGREARCASAAS